MVGRPHFSLEVFLFPGDFIYKVSSSLSPTRHFIIHSRKALLNGISPADNRKIPPLRYEYYFALLRDFPDLKFTINGGINSVGEVKSAISQGAHDGVMVGWAAYNKFVWCLDTMKSFLEETLDAIPDLVLDSAIAGAPCDFTNENPFANVRDRLPPPYDFSREEEVVSA